MRSLHSLLLACVIVLAFIIRIYQVDTHPSGVLIDEESFGYNAFSILETGKDEHQKAFPLIFTAFGDQKLPAYAYSLVPFIEIFGLTNLAIRLPSVIAGTLSVLFIYVLLRKFEFTTSQSMIGSLVAAVSPWTIILSRFAYESNIALLFFLVGLTTFFTYVKTNKSLLLVLSGISFGLTWYSYIAYRFVIPLVIVSLILVFLRPFKKSMKQILIFGLSVFMVILPLLSTLFSDEGTARFNQTGIFRDAGVAMEINENRTFCTEDVPNIICSLIYNKPIVISRMFIERYVELFSFEFLFFYGEEIQHVSVTNFGLLPYFVFPFYVAGICYLLINLFRKKSSKLQIFCLAGLLFTPLPAVLAGDPQRVRLTPFFPFILLTIMYGIAVLERQVNKRNYKIFYYAGIAGLLLLFGFMFMVSYVAIHVKKYDSTYGSHIPRLVMYLEKQPAATHIFFNSFSEAIHYYVYFAGISPREFQTSAKWNENKHNGFAHVTDFKNLHTTEKKLSEFVCNPEMVNSNVLYVTNREEEGFTPIETIKNYNSIHALYYIYDLKSGTTSVCEE